MSKSTYTYVDMTTNEVLFTETSHPRAYTKAVNEFRTDDRLGHNIKEFQNRTFDADGNVVNPGTELWDFILTKSKGGHNQLCNRAALARKAQRHEESLAKRAEYEAKMAQIRADKAAVKQTELAARLAQLNTAKAVATPVPAPTIQEPANEAPVNESPLKAKKSKKK